MTVPDCDLLPKGFPRRRRGSCVPAAYIMAVKFPDADVVAGLVGIDRQAGYQHTWIEHDGMIYDPTIRQFSFWRRDVKVVRLEKHRDRAFDFMHRFELAYLMPWLDQGAHYRKFSAWIGPILQARCQESSLCQK